MFCRQKGCFCPTMRNYACAILYEVDVRTSVLCGCLSWLTLDSNRLRLNTAISAPGQIIGPEKLVVLNYHTPYIKMPYTNETPIEQTTGASLFAL